MGMRAILFLAFFFLSSPAWAAFAEFQVFQPVISASPVSTIFQGDTTKSISSITPSITCLQTGTLQTPAFIQCTASATTASGSSNPYLDLQYVWTDNNPSPDTFVLPSPIGTRSSSKQYGPEYAQVFRAAGTYTVTLTVSGCTSGHPATAYTGGGGTCNGNAITTASTTQTVTVTAWSGTDFYFNTATGSDANACTLGSPCLTPNKCATTIEGGSNRRCNFDCGQTFDGTVGSSLRLSANASYSHARVQPGGADCPGADPIITLTSGSNSCMEVDQNGSGGVKNDIVISHINCTNSGSWSNVRLAFIDGNNVGAGSINNIFFDNIQANDSLDISGMDPIEVGTSSASTSLVYQGVVLWNVTSTTPVSALATKSGIIGGNQQYYSIVGGLVEGSGAGSATFNHQVYMHCGGHCLARWINTGPTCTGAGCTPTRDSCVKTSFDASDGFGNTVSSFWVISENYCESVSDLGGQGNNNNIIGNTQIDQYIQQQNVGNLIAGLSFPAVGLNMTVRDNWACLTGATSIGTSVGQLFSGSTSGTGEDANLVSNVYRNFVYNNSNGTSQGNETLSYYTNSDSWTHAQNIFDNIIQMNNASGFAANIPGTNFGSNGSFVDYDTWYAPNQAGNFFKNANTTVSFATWQGLGFDTHGSTSNPGFPSPSTCGFGTWPY